MALPSATEPEPGFRDPDTGKMVHVDSPCEIFHKLLGFPEQFGKTQRPPNKSGNICCTHEYGLGFPYRKTWHYNNKNGTKLFYWNETGPVTYIYSNGTAMYQNPPPSLGRKVFDEPEPVEMDAKVAIPGHSNPRGIDYTTAESKWSESNNAGGILETVAGSVIHYYPAEWGSRSTNTVLKMRVPSTWGTAFTFEDGLTSQYPRDTPLPLNLSKLLTGEVYDGESEMKMMERKAMVAAKRRELQKASARQSNKKRSFDSRNEDEAAAKQQCRRDKEVTNRTPKEERAAAKQQRREERAKRRLERRARNEERTVRKEERRARKEERMARKEDRRTRKVELRARDVISQLVCSRCQMAIEPKQKDTAEAVVSRESTPGPMLMPEQKLTPAPTQLLTPASTPTSIRLETPTSTSSRESTQTPTSIRTPVQLPTPSEIGDIRKLDIQPKQKDTGLTFASKYQPSEGTKKSHRSRNGSRNKRRRRFRQKPKVVSPIKPLE